MLHFCQRPPGSLFKSKLWFDIFYSQPPQGEHFSLLCACRCDAGSCEEKRELWSIKVRVVLAGIDVLGLKLLTLQNKNSWPLDHVDSTCRQNNEVWQLASCKSSYLHTKRDGRERWLMDGWKMCWQLGSVRETDGWMNVWMGGWKVGWMEGWFEGRMALMMAACHVSRQCFDNKSPAMASLLSSFCLFCHLLVWGEWGQLNRSRVLSHYTHAHTTHTSTLTQWVTEEVDDTHSHTPIHKKFRGHWVNRCVCMF